MLPYKNIIPNLFYVNQDKENVIMFREVPIIILNLCFIKYLNYVPQYVS